MHLRAQRVIPYVIVLAIASYLFFVATRIYYDGPPGRIGPDAWPKAILALAIVTCLYAVVRELVLAREDARAPAAAEESAEEQEPPRYPHLIITGIAMTLGYLLLIERIGFFLCTLLYLAGFMILGRYRRLGVVAVTSLAGAFVFMFVFMKIVYVSLPLGRGPFAEVSLLLMKLMGIK